MFSEETFATSLEEFDRDCRPFCGAVAIEVPDIFREQGKWKQIRWSFRIGLESGSVFDGIDFHAIKRGEHFRKIKFRHFLPDGSLLYMVDSHGSYVPYSETPHLHVRPPSSIRLEDGAWELCGQSLREFTVTDMWRMVKAYEVEGRLPWRTR